MTWGIPDWRDAAAYPAVKRTTLLQWWWQFTRRRPEYRALWLQFAPRHHEWVERNVEHMKFLAANDGCSVEEKIQWRRNFGIPTDDPFAIRKEFRMSTLANPSLDFSDHDLMHLHYSDGAHGIEFGTFEAVQTFQGDPSRKLIAFNVGRPIEGQLIAARRLLEEYQKEFVGKVLFQRPRKTNWPLFLRAIDARDAGATFQEVAKVLWPNQSKTPQSARDTCEAACRLRDNFPI
ncbi:MAG: hypothetical protein AB7F09_15855 [Parvibaculaceae bacterium]